MQKFNPGVQDYLIIYFIQRMIFQNLILILVACSAILFAARFMGKPMVPDFISISFFVSFHALQKFGPGVVKSHVTIRDSRFYRACF